MGVAKCFHRQKNYWKRKSFYDLYLLDIQLGQMTGMELAEKIREKDDHAVILLQQIIKK